MASRARATPLVADDLDDIPSDGNRYEIIDGVLRVTPSPSRAHQHILGALLVLLRPYAAALGITVYVAPLDVRASPVTQVEPDLLAVPRDVDRAITTRWSPMSVLLLAVEILSPSTTRVDRGKSGSFTWRKASISTGSWTRRRTLWRCGRRGLTIPSD